MLEMPSHPKMELERTELKEEQMLAMRGQVLGWNIQNWPSGPEERDVLSCCLQLIFLTGVSECLAHFLLSCHQLMSYACLSSLVYYRVHTKILKSHLRWSWVNTIGKFVLGYIQSIMTPPYISSYFMFYTGPVWWCKNWVGNDQF